MHLSSVSVFVFCIWLVCCQLGNWVLNSISIYVFCICNWHLYLCFLFYECVANWLSFGDLVSRCLLQINGVIEFCTSFPNVFLCLVFCGFRRRCQLIELWWLYWCLSWWSARPAINWVLIIIILVCDEDTCLLQINEVIEFCILHLVLVFVFRILCLASVLPIDWVLMIILLCDEVHVFVAN